MLSRLSFLSPYGLWFLFALPGGLMLGTALTSGDPRIFHELVHPSGEFSARLLIVAMMATPLAMLLRGWRGPIWLKKNRRYLGVASFGYAALHTLFYVIDKGSMAGVINEVSRFYIWTGWIAFVIFVPLAVTSTDYFVRIMGAVVENPAALDLWRCDFDLVALGGSAQLGTPNVCNRTLPTFDPA